MGKRRPLESRVHDWLSGDVAGRRIAGQAVTLVCVQVCQGTAETTRVDALDDGLSGLAGRVAMVLRLYAPDDQTRGTAFNLYALDAQEKRYAGPYAVRVFPQDLDTDESPESETPLARPGQGRPAGESLGISQGDPVLRALLEYQSREVQRRDGVIERMLASVVGSVESIQGAVGAIAGQYEIALKAVQATAERAELARQKADDRTDRAMALVETLQARAEELQRDLDRAERGTDALVDMAVESVKEFKRNARPNGSG